MATGRPIAMSAMHHQHLSVGAVMVDSNGWRRPARYTSFEDEVNRLQRSVGICDISPMGKFLIQGDAINTLLETAFPDAGKLEIGRAYRSRVNGDIGVQDVVVTYLASDEALVLTLPNEAALVSQTLGEDSARCAHVVDVTSAYAGLMIAGPLAHGLLSAVTEVDVAGGAFPDKSCLQAMFAEIHGALLRSDVEGLLSYELYFGREYGEYMWDVIMEAGAEYSVFPFGIEALARLADDAPDSRPSEASPGRHSRDSKGL